MVCEWCVLIEEDKDNSLQFFKVFPTKFLKLPIRQVFSHHRFALYGTHGLLQLCNHLAPNLNDFCELHNLSYGTGICSS